MSLPENAIEVSDTRGWRKQIPLPAKSIVHLGSHAENDIVLAGEGVEPLHAQIIAPTSDRTVFQLVNLAEADIRLGAAGEQLLPPRSSTELLDGSVFKLGEFAVVFRGGGGFFGGPVVRQTANIGVQLAIKQTRLAPGQAVDGQVTIRNLGTNPGAQFELELDGLDTDCYELEPGPLLSSGAEKEILLRIFHRGPKPLHGECRITLTATAPKSYPGETVMVSQLIEVAPYFRHQLGLLKPAAAGQFPPTKTELELLPKPKSSAGARPADTPPSAGTSPEPAPAESDWWGPAPPSAAETAPRPDDWWNSAPETQPAASQKTEDWWDTASQPATVNVPRQADDFWSAPAPASQSAIPAAANVPRQADDFWSAPAPASEPAIPAAADVPRQADDFWSAPAPTSEPAIPAAEPAPTDDFWSAPAPASEQVAPPPAVQTEPEPAPETDWWVSPAPAVTVQPPADAETTLANQLRPAAPPPKPVTIAPAKTPTPTDWWADSTASQPDPDNLRVDPGPTVGPPPRQPAIPAKMPAADWWSDEGDPPPPAGEEGPR